MARLFMCVLFMICYANAMPIAPTEHDALALSQNITTAKVLYLNEIDTFSCLFNGDAYVHIYHNNKTWFPHGNGYDPVTQIRRVTTTLTMTYENAGKYQCVADNIYRINYRAVVGPLTCKYVHNNTACSFTASHDPESSYELHWSDNHNPITTINDDGTITFTTIFQNRHESMDVHIRYRGITSLLSWSSISSTTKKIVTFASTTPTTSVTRPTKSPRVTPEFAGTSVGSSEVIHLNQINTIMCKFAYNRPPIMIRHKNETFTPVVTESLINVYEDSEPVKTFTLTLIRNMTFEAGGKYTCIVDRVMQTTYRAVIGPLNCEYVDNTTVCNFTASYDPENIYGLDWGINEGSIVSTINNDTTVTFVTVFQKHYDHIMVVVKYRIATGYLTWGNSTLTTKKPMPYVISASAGTIKHTISLLLIVYVFK